MTQGSCVAPGITPPRSAADSPLTVREVGTCCVLVPRPMSRLCERPLATQESRNPREGSLNPFVLATGDPAASCEVVRPGDSEAVFEGLLQPDPSQPSI